MKSYFYAIAIFVAASFTACSTTQTLQIEENATTQATLWVQNSAEFKALATQAYASALRTLPLPLNDSFWTASLVQAENEDYMQLPPAIILDIDETVLDNSPFQARLIKEGKSYNTADWNAWCNEANAKAIPGAVEFTQYAAEQGVAIFYVSNREYVVEDATRRNLIKEGFPVSDSLDVILSKGEQPNWTSSKVERRKEIEKNYRVIMLVGDDLNDFLPAKGFSQQERDSFVEKYSDYFGRKWIFLPNPLYGSWEQALYGEDGNSGENARMQMLNKRLHTKDKSKN